MKLIIIISMYPLFVHEQLHVHSTNFEKKLNQIKTKLNNHKRSSRFTCSDKISVPMSKCLS